MRITIILPALVVLLQLSSTVNAQTGQERILLFDAAITIDGSGRVVVSEKIRINTWGDFFKRGIFRSIPTLKRGAWGENYNSNLEVLAVSRDGNPEPYHIESETPGKVIYVGSEDNLLAPGVYTYDITYSIHPVIRPFDTFDELYWNVTGDGWSFMIDSVRANVTVPAGAVIKDEAVSAYLGPAGTTTCDGCIISLVNPEKAEFSITRTLREYEGFTIAIPFSKGFVSHPTQEEKRTQFLRDNAHLLVMIAGFFVLLAYYTVLWFRFGRDPEGRPNRASPEPPEGFPPYALRYIRQMQFDEKVVVSAFTWFAQRGLLSIEEKEDKTFVLRKKDIDPALLTDTEKRVMDQLFAQSGEVALNGEYNPVLFEARYALQKDLEAIRPRFFSHNSGWIVLGAFLGLAFVGGAGVMLDGEQRVITLFLSFFISFWSIGCTLLVSEVVKYARLKKWGMLAGMILFSSVFVGAEIVVGVLFITNFGVIPGGIFFLLIAITIAFYFWLKAPTKDGQDLLERTEDFALYLKTARHERLQSMSPTLALDMQMFERFLPYAIALDLEGEWSSHFKIVTAPAGDEILPWYRRSSPFSDSHDISSSLSTSFGSSMTSSSTSSSSSGSSGSGSSGGGSGGGGGGGW